MSNNGNDLKIGYIIFEGRFWITAWGHFRRFEASKVIQNRVNNEAENEIEKGRSYTKKKRLSGTGSAAMRWPLCPWLKSRTGI